MSMPACPNCGTPMTGGAPHGPWPIQWECCHCGKIIIASDSEKAKQK